MERKKVSCLNLALQPKKPILVRKNTPLNHAD
jgi:hypothetical protein